MQQHVGLLDDYDGLISYAPAAIDAETSPLPFELVESSKYHGPYIINAYGGTVCDFYTMSNPAHLSVRNGGDSKPVPFSCADGNAAFMVRAANCHEQLVAALKAAQPLWHHMIGLSSPPEWHRVNGLIEDAIAAAEARP